MVISSAACSGTSAQTVADVQHSLESPTLAHSCSLVGWTKTSKAQCHVWTIHWKQLFTLNDWSAALLRLKNVLKSFILWQENGTSILTHSDYLFFLHLIPYFIWRCTSSISHVLKHCIHFVVRPQRVANLRVSGINGWKRCVSFWICLLRDIECALLVPIKMCYGFSMSLPFTYHSCITQGVSEWARHEQLVKMTITSWVCFVEKRRTQFKCTHTSLYFLSLFRTSKTNQSNWYMLGACMHIFYFLVSLQIRSIHILAYGPQTSILRTG